MTGPETEKQECCPKFDPAPWDDKLFRWDAKPFLKDKVLTLFYMPLNFGAVMRRIMGRADRSGAKSPDQLCLSEHTSKWNMNVYLAVDKAVQGAESVSLSGQYLSKVYEGDFKETRKWCEDYGRLAEARGLAVKKRYMWYTTCPKCAKKYGKNYVAVIGEVEAKERA